MLTYENILHETTRMVEEGLCVTLPVDGRSMLPFIIGGRDSVLLSKPEDVMVGDIVLAWIENRRYVVHRILEIRGQHVTLMGDGNLYGKEYCTLADIKAKALYVVDTKGKKHNLYAPWRKGASRAWLFLKPIRRYLLLFVRIIYGIEVREIFSRLKSKILQ